MTRCAHDRPPAGNERASTVRCGLMIACLVGSLAWPATTRSQPGPVGPEYGAEERPLPGPQWWRSCTTEQGTTFAVSQGCTRGGCSDPAGVFLDRSKPDGSPIGQPTLVNTTPASANFPLRVTCQSNGWVVVQWVDRTAHCYFHRVFDDRARPAGAPQQFLEHATDCRIRPDIAVHDDGSFITAWATGFWEDQAAIMARQFDTDGTATTGPIVVSRSSDGWRERAKVAVDSTGHAMVAWRRTPGHETDPPGTILARFLDPDGRLHGEEIVVNSFPYGEVSGPVVRPAAAGGVEILWSNWLQGGRVARRLVADLGAERALSPARAVAPDANMPSFGASRIIDSAVSSIRTADERWLLAGGPGAWILDAAGPGYQRSVDEGGVWERPTPPSSPEDVDARVLATGSDRNGAWVALHGAEHQPDLYASRSTDEGRTWSSPEALPSVERSSVCEGCRFTRSAVAGTPGGTWIAAVSRAGWRGPEDEAPSRVDIVRSTDGGRSWRVAAEVARDLGAGWAGFDLATDGAGTWVLMWADEHLWVSRSTNDGARWSKPRKLADDVVCMTCRLHQRYSRLELATDEAGLWAAIFASPRHDTDRYGHDADIFIVRSADRGVSWTTPAALHADAGSDGARDSDPTLATDGAGTWLAAWTSHRPAGGGDDLDADVFVSVSTDAAISWSGPVVLAADAATRTGLDRTPHIASNDAGQWMIAWSSRDLSEPEPTSTHRILLAGIGAQCGNGQIETAEQCDDANLTDGDGCDHDCSATGCGNGIATAGEDCDDGNSSRSDACMPECRAPICGNAIVEGLEECDDGNAVETDDCLSTCRTAVCGDGHVHAGRERCDDGNSSNTDACTTRCRAARCGDGYVQEGVEACDTGYRLGEADCPYGCREAVCGDGFTSWPYEDCDPLDSRYADVCSEDCRLPDICGDANVDGLVTAADAQQILQRSVGVQPRCPLTVCDMNGTRSVTVTDAAMALGKAVGITVDETCSIGTGSILFWTPDPRLIGALQLEVDYASTGGRFLGEGQGAECEFLFGGVPAAELDELDDDDDVPFLGFGAVNNQVEHGMMVLAFTSVHGFEGPIDLVRCNFELSQGTPDRRFDIRIVDASDPYTDPLSPPPVIGYRLE